MIPAFLVKTVIKQVMKAIKKADDKVIAGDHERRIKKLEKNCKCGKVAKNKKKKTKERF